MRRSLLFSFVLFFSTVSFAQTMDNSLFMEIGGPSNLVGIGYEHRFDKQAKWGWRTGLGFIYSEQSGIFVNNSDLRGWTVPLELNYLAGRSKNHLELGVGLNLGYYNVHEETVYLKPISQNANGDYLYDEERQRCTHNTWGHFFYGNVGYRHQSTKGFIFRVGISPSFSLGNSHAVSKAFFWPYISMGRSF